MNAAYLPIMFFTFGMEEQVIIVEGEIIANLAKMFRVLVVVEGHTIKQLHTHTHTRYMTILQNVMIVKAEDAASERTCVLCSSLLR